MKKLFLYGFTAATLAFGLVSCGDDCEDVNCPAGQICDEGTCVDDPNATDPCDDVTCAAGEVCEDGNCVPEDDTNPTCEICGDYDGTIDSDSLRVQFPPAADIDTTLMSYPATAGLATTSFSDSLALTVELELSGTPIEVTVNAAWDGGNNITVVDKIYNYLGAVPILVNGTGVGNPTDGTMTADIELDDEPGAANDAIYAEIGFAGDVQ